MEIEKLLNKIKKEKKIAFLMCDYNTNTLSESNKTIKHVNEFSNIFASNYYHKLISLPTREKKYSSTLIDNIYTNIPDCYNTCSSGVLKFLTQSDHYPIFTLRKETQQPTKQTHIIKRNHNEKNQSMFKKRFKHNDWNYSIRPDSSISLFSCFINTIISDYKACFSVQTIKLNYKNINPWIYQSLRNDIKIRDNLYMLSRKNPTIDNIKIYKTFKNRNLAKQRQAQRNYYKEQFQLNKTDLKKSWQLIKHIIGIEEGSHSIQLKEFVINKMYITDPKIIANSFNDYFINVGSSLANNINSNVDPLLYVQRHTNNMNIPEVSEFEIKNIIQDLKNSAAGYDELPASIFEKVSDIYINPLTYFINMSIREGIVPEELKLAKVIPIYKGEDDQLIQNYRPISVLPFFSKIFEKIIFINVIEFLNENKLFYDCQFGFRKNHGTSHAIITLTERVSKALDTGKIVVGVFLDLKKAFDTVDHNILLQKLEKYGMY